MILIQTKKSTHIYIKTDFNTKIQRNLKVNKFDIYMKVEIMIKWSSKHSGKKIFRNLIIKSSLFCISPFSVGESHFRKLTVDVSMI